MTGDQYLQAILIRENVDIGLLSPVRCVQKWLMPLITDWAQDNLITVHPSGSFVKGTAIKSGTDIDLFISLSEGTPHTLQEIYDRLFRKLEGNGYKPRRQNVSLNIKAFGYSVDLVPAKRQNALSNDHSLYVRKANTWKKTNVVAHVAFVQGANRLQETKILKLWRNRRGLDLPSFYLQMVVARALAGRPATLADNVSLVFEYLRDSFTSARFVDPANTNNILSDELTAAEKQTIANAGKDCPRHSIMEGCGAMSWTLPKF